MAKIFIERPIFAWVIALFIMVAGAVSITQLPIAQYPPVAPPSIIINATYPGASAKTLEDNVLSVIEQEMTGSPGLIYMEAVAQANGTGSITLSFEPPLICSVIFYRLVFALIFAMQYFGNAMLVGGLSGNPDRNTLFYNVYLYRAGWTLNEMGYASALAWFLFVLAGAVTIGLFASQKKWVFYATGD